MLLPARDPAAPTLRARTWIRDGDRPLIGLALLIGLGGGLGAALFRELIIGITKLATGHGDYAGLGRVANPHVPWLGPWFLLIVPVLGGLIYGPLLAFFAPEARGHGVPEVMLAVARQGGRIRPRVALIKALASAACIGTGGSVGREGPIVQIGSALGSTLGQWAKLDERQLRLLVGCGAAAGISATFDTPIAGVFFAMEVILRDVSTRSFGLPVISSVAAAAVGRAAFGDDPFLSLPSVNVSSAGDLVAFALLGVLAALVGTGFVKTLYGIEDLADRVWRGPAWARPACGGLLLGVLLLALPELYGVGYPVLQSVVAGHDAVGLVLLLLMAKAVATSLTIAIGGSGGVFAPSLFVGAMLGSAYGRGLHALFGHLLTSPSAYGVVGMGAVFAAGARAPMTAVLILLELTGDTGVILPAMLAIVVATTLSEQLSADSIYTLKLRRRGIDIDAPVALEMVPEPEPPVVDSVEGVSAPSYAAGPTDRPLLETTIGAALAATAARFGEREALVVPHQDVRWSYAELLERTDALARALLALGLRTGDRLGIWSPNRAEWMLAQYATARAGIVLVTVNPAYRTHELRFALQQSGCRALLAAPAFKGSDYAAMLAEVREELPALEHAVFFDTPEWEALLARAGETAADALAALALDPDDPINVQYTSGTTGLPKGATLSHRNILNNGHWVGEGCGYTEADRICVPVPYYHCFGMVMGNLAALTHGAAVVLPGEAFEPEAVLRSVQDERCTSLYGVPTMFIAELDHPRFGDYDLSSLRTGIMAGSPCPKEVMRRALERMGMSEVTICYGMTETSPVSTQTGPDDDLEHRTGTVGTVLPHLEVRVCDPESGEVVERGTAGELQTRGYSVMLGYWEEPERTAAAVDADGWMHTGDQALMAQDGYLQITGRIKDLVIRGGENVSPREVEEFLYAHPDIADVQVVGVPDARFGEELCAWVIPRAGATLEAEAVRAFCAGRIAHYKVPRYVCLCEEFPMTVTGKVRKIELRERAVEELGLSGTGVTPAPA